MFFFLLRQLTKNASAAVDMMHKQKCRETEKIIVMIQLEHVRRNLRCNSLNFCVASGGSGLTPRHQLSKVVTFRFVTCHGSSQQSDES